MKPTGVKHIEPENQRRDSQPELTGCFLCSPRPRPRPRPHLCLPLPFSFAFFLFWFWEVLITASSCGSVCPFCYQLLQYFCLIDKQVYHLTLQLFSHSHFRCRLTINLTWTKSKRKSNWSSFTDEQLSQEVDGLYVDLSFHAFN